MDKPEKKAPVVNQGGPQGESPAEEFREAELSSEMNVAQVHGSIMREREDPQDGYEPVPLWMVTLIMVLLFWGGMYLAGNSGGYRADVFDPTLVSWTGEGVAVDTGPPDPMVLGRRVYVQNCVVCHQSSGQGVAGQFPPLAGSEWVLSEGWHGDNHLVKLVLHGLQGPIQVMGNTYNNVMTPHAHILNDEQVAAVLTYIRNEWGNEAPPITPEYVAYIREQTEGRRNAYTQPELQEAARELVADVITVTETEEVTEVEEGADAPPAPDAAEETETPSA